MPSARLQQLVHTDERWPGVKKPREATTLGSLFSSFFRAREEGRKEGGKKAWTQKMGARFYLNAAEGITGEKGRVRMRGMCYLN